MFALILSVSNEKATLSLKLGAMVVSRTSISLLHFVTFCTKFKNN